MMKRKSIFPWHPGGFASKSGTGPMSQRGPVEPDPALSPVELELISVLVELDELLLELTSAELVIGKEVPGAVSPVVTSPAGLHATAP